MVGQSVLPSFWYMNTTSSGFPAQRNVRTFAADLVKVKVERLKVKDHADCTALAFSKL